MFRKNEYQQMNFNDSVLNIPKYLQKILKNCWAHDFQEYKFPAIDEDRFEELLGSIYFMLDISMLFA